MALEAPFYLSPIQSQAHSYTDQECLLCDCYKKTDMMCLPHSSLSETDSLGDIRPWGCTELHWGRKVDPSPRAPVQPHSILGSKCCRLR